MKKSVVLFSILLLGACSSVRKDYVITNSSYTPIPKWAKKEAKKSDDDYKYFVSKAENINQRLCEKTASARANAVIASEIASTVNNTYKSIVESKDEEASELSNETLQQNINVYLAGVEQAESYWEKRKYSKELGSEKDKTSYQCYVLLKMNKKNYEKAVNASIEKMMQLIQSNDNELKNEIKNEILNNNE